jgi:hypothetical protein
LHISAIFALAITAVIAALAVDLALGRMRELPVAALFRTVHIALLVVYLALGATVAVPQALLVVWVPVLIGLLVAYLALGAAQLTAIAAGLEERWTARWRARLVALLLAYLPVLGSAAAVWGATTGWSWTTGLGVMRFFGPLAAIAAPPLVFFGAVMLQS